MGAAAWSVTRETPVAAFDPEQLAKQKYLRADEAAFYLGYKSPAYVDPTKAFLETVRQIPRADLPRCYFGRVLLFLRADLDRYVQATRTVLHQEAKR